MKKFLFKTISITLVFFHLFTVCLRDAAFAAPAKAAKKNASKAAAKSTSKAAPKDKDASSKKPPLKPASTSDNLLLQNKITSAAGFNLSALQSFQSDPFTGKASFSLPIAVPPGRKGMQPNIALTYSSGGANGILGAGWGLELGSIERSTKKGPPRYDASDTFVFNSGSPAELIYRGDNEYRAKIEGGFMKFVFDGSGWVVTDKAGTRYYFGQSEESRQGENGRIFKWCMDKAVDVNGNYLRVAYIKEENQIYPELIEYTGNETGALAPASSVKFDYDGRPDGLSSYRSGFKVVTARRLSAIAVKFNDKLVRRYQLEYDLSETGRSLLASVTQYGADDKTCLPPVSFEYTDHNQPRSIWQRDDSWQISDLPEFFCGRDNGVRTVDLNNDGLIDVIQALGGVNYSRAFINQGASEKRWQETSWQIPFTFTDERGPGNIDGGTRFAYLDKENGWLSVVKSFQGTGTLDRGIYLNNLRTHSFELQDWSLPEDVVIVVDHPGLWNGVDGATFEGVLLQDVNADGFSDILRPRDYTYLYEGQKTWGRDSNWLMPAGDFKDGSTQMAELNGDGLIDFAIVKDNYKATYLNMGSGWLREPALDLPSDSAINFCGNGNQFVDINGDGLADIVISDNLNRKTYLNHNGREWVVSGKFALPAGVELNKAGTRIIDINGDCLPDIIKRDNSSLEGVWINNAKLSGLLTKISNGIGGQINIAYKSSTEFDNTGEDDISDLPFPVYVVEGVTVHDGVNPQSRDIVTRYEYKNGLFDFSEREFRGFGEVRVIDAEGNYSLSEFHQGPVLKGRPRREEVRDAQERLYSVTLNKWSIEPKTNFVYLASSASRIYDGDDSFEQVDKEFRYDEYGNLVEAKTTGSVYRDKVKTTETKTQITAYVYNEDAHILLTPKYTKLLDNNGGRVWQKWFYYDDQNSVDGPPLKGLLTKQEAWLYNPLTIEEERVPAGYSYDDYGNLISTTDAKGHTTTTIYDQRYHIYPVKVINPLGHTVETVYYDVNEPASDPINAAGVPGQLKYTQDPNGRRSYTIYDALGRVTGVIGPRDTLDEPAAAYKYELNTTPVKITKAVKINYGPGTQDKEELASSAAAGIFSEINRSYNGKKDAVILPDSDGWDFGGEDFTIDFWAKFDTLPSAGASMRFYHQQTFVPDLAHSFSLIAQEGNGGLALYVNVYNGSAELAFQSEYDLDITADTWHHIVFLRRDYLFEIYLDGKLVADVTRDFIMPDIDAQVSIGASAATGANYFNGFIDEFRVTKGQALWAGSGFTPLRAAQAADSSKDAPQEAAYLTVYQFMDGLSRVLQTRAPAQSDSVRKEPRQIVSGSVNYDARGKVKEKYLPYFDGKTSSYRATVKSTPCAHFEYDALGRIKKTVNPDGSYSGAFYSDGVTTVVDENGHKAVKYSDAFGKVGKVEEYRGSDGRSDNYPYEEYSLYATTYYEYDGQGNLGKVIDQEGNTTKIWYDSLGRKIRMDDADMGLWSYEYDEIGNLIKQTDAKGQVLEFGYDELNRLVNKRGSAGGKSPVTLAAYIYDDASRANRIGRLYKVNYPGGSTEFFYDELGREIKSVKVVGGTPYQVARAYDAADNLTRLRYPDGEKVTYTYSSDSGQLSRIEGKKAYVKEIIYTQTGQIRSIKYGNDAETTYDYDPLTLRLSHLTTEAPCGTVQDLSYRFDSGGNISEIIDSVNTASQSFNYDHLGRLVKAEGAYGSFSYDYDAIGNMLYKEGVGLDYGKDGRLPHAVTRYGDTLIDYDANGNMISKASSPEEGMLLSYDIENRLSRVEKKTGGESEIKITLFPGWNFISFPALPRDREITSVLASIEGKYDQVSRYNRNTKKFEHYLGSGTCDQFKKFEYGQGYQIYITSTEEVVLSVKAEPAKNETPVILKKGHNLIFMPGRLEADVEAALLPLKIGVDYSRILYYNKASGEFHEYSKKKKEFAALKPGVGYYLEALKNANWKPASGSAVTTTFTYDGDGGRVRKTVGSFTTTYIGSLFEREARISTDGTRIGTDTKHIFAGSNRICSVTRDVKYFHSDHLGSSNVVTNEKGEQAGYTEFTPYGSTFKQTGTYDPRHKFTGKELDASTGLYYYGARYYDAEIGRFISADTIVQAPYDPQSLNRYSYCRNNPVNYVDPTGHVWWFIPLIVSAIKGAAIGSLIGGVVAAATGGNIGQGFLTGAISGACFGFTGGLGLSAGIPSILGHSLSGAISGTINASIVGGDIGMGAAIGGFSAGASEFLGAYAPFLGNAAGSGFGGLARNFLARTATGAIVGGGVAAAFGGDFGRGAQQGAVTSAIAYTANHVMHMAGEKAKEALNTQQEPRPTKQVDLTKETPISKLVKESIVSTEPGSLLRRGAAILKAGGYKIAGTVAGTAGLILEPTGTWKLTGTIVGGATGAKFGAGIGTAINPGAGTFIGTVVGGIAGGAIGGKALGQFDDPSAIYLNYNEWE